MNEVSIQSSESLGWLIGGSQTVVVTNSPKKSEWCNIVKKLLNVGVPLTLLYRKKIQKNKSALSSM